MIFGHFPTQECAGAILAHAVALDHHLLKKGTLLREEDLAEILAAKIPFLMVARLETGDVGENEAALRIARLILGPGTEMGMPATGRVNIFALERGLVLVDSKNIDALNAIDEAITIATVPPDSEVDAGQMIATIKIIPFAISKKIAEKAARLSFPHAPLSVRAFRNRPIGFIQTFLQSTKPALLDKTSAIMATRLARYGATATLEIRAPHDQASLEKAIDQCIDQGAEIICILGGSAITDRRDIIPAAILKLGGIIDRLGMPVDPGNLLLLTHIGKLPILGLPGCARSPLLNGMDRVLARLLADIPVSGEDIQRMGVGGLLLGMAPEEKTSGKKEEMPKGVAALILAAGKSSRMGTNKLLLPYRGKTVVECALNAAHAADIAKIILVGGHEYERLASIPLLPSVALIEEPDYERGMSVSLKRGIEALPKDANAFFVLLADMPDISAALLRKMATAFQSSSKDIVVPVRHGRRGNPILWSSRYKEEICSLHGDRGGRTLLQKYSQHILEIEWSDDSIFFDIDEPGQYRQATEAGT